MNKVKLVALLISFSLIFTNQTTGAISQIANVSSLPSNQPNILQQTASKVLPIKEFVLPANVGKITSSKNFDSDEIVINIQDLHCHAQAQRNIAKIIEQIDDSFEIDNIYLEGASGKIDVQWLISANQTQVGKKFINLLLDNGRISGSEYYSAIKGKANFIQGIEEKNLYDTNIKLLQEINSFKNDINAICDELEEQLKEVKNIYFNKDIKKINEIKSKDAIYYYKNLEKILTANKIDLANYNDLSSYIKYLNLKSTIKDESVREEFYDFVDKLKNRVSYSKYKEIVVKSNNFTNIENIVDDIIATGTLDKYKQLSKFISLLKQKQTINPTRLVYQEQKLTRDLYNQFSRTEYEQRVTFLVNFVKYIRDYFTAQITAKDYNSFAKDYAKFKRYWNDYCVQNIPQKLEKYEYILSKYHQNNIKRDHIFTNKIIGDLNKTNTEIVSNTDNKKIKLIVTGGFHSVGIENILNNNKISYIVITPVITESFVKANDQHSDTINKYAQILNNTINIPTITETILVETILPDIIPILIEATKDINDKQVTEEVNELFKERLKQGKSKQDIKSFKFTIESQNGQKIYHILYKDNQGIKKNVYYDINGKVADLKPKASIVENQQSVLNRFSYVWEEFAFRIIPVALTLVPQFFTQNILALSVANPLTIGVLSITTIGFALAHSIYDKINGIQTDNRFKQLLAPSIAFSLTYFVSSLILTPYVSWIVPIITHYIYNKLVDKGVLNNIRASIANKKLTPEQTTKTDVALRLPKIVTLLKEYVLEDVPLDNLNEIITYRAKEDKENNIYILKYYNRYDDVVNIINTLDTIQKQNRYSDEEIKVVEKSLQDLYNILQNDIVDSIRTPESLPQQKLIASCIKLEMFETISRLLNVTLPLVADFSNLEGATTLPEDSLMFKYREFIKKHSFNEHTYWKTLTNLADQLYFDGIKNERAIYFLLRGQDFMFDPWSHDKPDEAKFVSDNARARGLWDLILTNNSSVDVVDYSSSEDYNEDIIINTRVGFTNLVSSLPESMKISKQRNKGTNITSKSVVTIHNIDEFINMPTNDEVDTDSSDQISKNIYDKIIELDLLAKESFYEFYDTTNTQQETIKAADKMFVQIQNMIELLKYVEDSIGNKHADSEATQATLDAIKEQFAQSVQNNNINDFINYHKYSFEEGSVDKLISTLHQALLRLSFEMSSKFKISINDTSGFYGSTNFDIKSDSLVLPAKIKDLFLRLSKLSSSISVSDIVVSGNRIVLNYSPSSHHSESKNLIIDFDTQKITFSGFRDLKDYEEDAYSVDVEYSYKNDLEKQGFSDVQNFDVNTSYSGSGSSTKNYSYSKTFSNTNTFLEEAYRQVLIHFVVPTTINNRDELKEKLNNILEYLLLPQIPESIELKYDYQVQELFNDVVEQAYAKGLIVKNADGVLVPIASTAKECEYKCVENLLTNLEQDYNTYQEGFKNAQAINALFIGENFYLNTQGADISIGKEGFRVISRIINLQNGSKIALNGILDIDKERFPWLQAEYIDADGNKTVLDNLTLIKLLNENGFKVKPQAPRNSGEISRTIKILQSTTQMKYYTPNIAGDIISKTKKGYTIGEITYDKVNSEGKVYVGVTLAAGEADVLDKMKGAIVTSGGIYSHGSTQVRESETTAALVNGQWVDGKLHIKCSTPVEQKNISKYNVVKYKNIDKTLEEGSIVLMKVINSATTNIFVFSNDIKDDLKYLVDLVGEQDTESIKKYLLSDGFKNLNKENKKQILEFVYFEVISNKGLENLLAFLIRDISNDDIRELNENYIRIQINDIKQKLENLDLSEDIDLSLNYIRVKELISDINRIRNIVDDNDNKTITEINSLLLQTIKYRNNIESALKLYIKQFKAKALEYINISVNELDRSDIRDIQVLIREAKWNRYFGNNEEVKSMIDKLSSMLAKVYKKSNRTVRKIENIWDERYGGKALGIAEINRFLKDKEFADITKGVEVLDGFGINPDKLSSLQEYSENVKQLEIIRQQILATNDVANRKKLTQQFKSLANQTVKFLNDNRDVIIEEIKEVTEDLLDKNKTYAVRSSGMGEDGVNSTFAGLAESYLNMKPEMVPEYIVNTVISFFNENATDYIIKNGVVRPRVFVEEFLDMDEAGVIFSDTTNYKLTIEVVKGLGMTLVDGDFSPDHIEVSSDGNYILLRGLNNTIKKVASSDWGVVEKVLTKEEKQARLLSTEQIKQMQQVTKALKKYYGSAIDVEFGIKDKKLYLLQVRTITTLIDNWEFDETVKNAEQEKVLLLDSLINQLFHNDTIELVTYDNLSEVNWMNALEHKNIQPVVRGKHTVYLPQNAISIDFSIDETHSKQIQIYIDTRTVKPIIYVDCQQDELSTVIELFKKRVNDDPVIKAKIVSLLYPTLASKIKRFIGMKEGYLGDIGAKIQKEFNTDFNTISLMLEQLNVSSIVKISKWIDSIGKSNMQKCNAIYNLLKPMINNKVYNDEYLQENGLLEYKNDIIQLVEYMDTDTFDAPKLSNQFRTLLNVNKTDLTTIKIIALIMNIGSNDKQNIALSILDDLDYLIIDTPTTESIVNDITDVKPSNIHSMLTSA